MNLKKALKTNGIENLSLWRNNIYIYYRTEQEQFQHKGFLMHLGALLLNDVFLEKTSIPKLNPDYVANIKSNNHRDDRCRNLFAGILIWAIRDLMGQNKQHKDTAVEWLNSPNDTCLSSFINVCDVLNLDAQKTREKIKAYTGNKNTGLPGTINMSYLQQ